MSVIHRGALRLATGLVLAGAGPVSAQTEVSGAIESNHVFCTSACNIYGGQINTDSSAGSTWVMLLDATSLPSNGLLTSCTVATSPRPCIMKWYQMTSSQVLSIINFMGFNASNRLPTKTGFVAACSSTGPFTLTASAHCLFSFENLTN